ncbi:glycosyltransferase family 9 protein [uncultured Pseudodesulfovibrio sp.]|uniref:glycosyltransferase family 9 protein n=1 Tax=uncultured Pseudodesulfovibrio sp. TaxID=2035858 RepID=UPI0029C82B96|nr:glycosyltransferase family 9 protein [uncultured Pseudodesulfovibrio sp.]
MKHYLVIQLARFGDLIQTKRLLTTLCAEEGASVHLCVDTSLKSLAELVYPSVTVHSITAHGTGLDRAEAIQAMLSGNSETFRALKTFNFEKVFNLNFSGLNFRMASLFSPEQIEGYAWHNGQEIIGLWPTMAMRWANRRRIAINLVDFWGGYRNDMVAPEKVNPPATPNGGGLGVVLAGRESRRSLPVEVLSQITATLAQTQKAQKISLLGGPSEQAAGQALLKSLPASVQDKTTNLAGKTNWANLVDIVDSLDVLLTPDTGTMHLAAHLGTPVTGFFLSSAWCFETGPYGLGHTVYQAVTDCLPCLETTPCCFDTKCLTPFADSRFLRFLATQKEEHLPNGMTAFKSEFDELGQIYVPTAGNDPDAMSRNKFREFIMQYLTGKGGKTSDLDKMFAQEIYREKDWIANTIPSATLGL